jgi:hypothetical protein
MILAEASVCFNRHLYREILGVKWKPSQFHPLPISRGHKLIRVANGIISFTGVKECESCSSQPTGPATKLISASICVQFQIFPAAFMEIVTGTVMNTEL